MTKFLRDNVRWISSVFIVFILAVSPAQSRMWSRSSTSVAQDYMVINDNRGGGEIVFIIWLAPPALGSEPSTQTVREILDKYVVVGVIHARASKDGALTFDRVAALDAKDGNGQPLTSLNTDSLPPTVVGTLATIQSAYSRGIGAVGPGTQWFVFDGGSVRACAKGGMSVLFADEKYTYDTPIPGCP